MLGGGRGRAEPAYVLGGVFTAALVLAAVLGRLRLPVQEATACFATLVLVASVMARQWAAAASAVIAWSLLTGFVVNELGTLTFRPADLLRLGVLVALALAVAQVTGPRGRPPVVPVAGGDASGVAEQ